MASMHMVNVCLITIPLTVGWPDPK
jgi:hypothetical protein